MQIIQPEIVVALGATAAQALMGRDFRVTKQYGEMLTVTWAKAFVATVHPSSILRTPPSGREEAYTQFVEDLKVVSAFCEKARR